MRGVVGSLLVADEPYGVESREPVYSGTRRVPGLYQRRVADGGLVFEARLHRGGRVRRFRLFP